MAWRSLGSLSWRRQHWLGPVILGVFLLSGCGLFGSTADAPTPAPTRTSVPTFTPTPVQPTAAPTSAPAADQPQAPTVEVAAAPVVAPTATPSPTPTPTQPPAAELTVAGDLTNIRSGPGTDYPVIGTANTGDLFPVVSRSVTGDWWEICCVNGQNGWIFGDLATVTGGDTRPCRPRSAG